MSGFMALVDNTGPGNNVSCPDNDGYATTLTYF
jgi:hypothetical protein